MRTLHFYAHLLEIPNIFIGEQMQNIRSNRKSYRKTISNIVKQPNKLLKNNNILIPIKRNYYNRKILFDSIILDYNCH